jgi:hypothetical protein
MSRIRKLPRMDACCDQIMPVPVMPCCVIADLPPPIPILYQCESLYPCRPCCQPNTDTSPTPFRNYSMQSKAISEQTTITTGQIKKYTSNIECPTGTILIYSGDEAPTGYLMCDGSEISRDAYPNLFIIIGEHYGKGNGYTTFNIPNLLGKIIDTMDGVENNINIINYIIKY